MRILITGGFGFLGGRLAVHLAQAAHTIVLGSRKAIGSPSWLPHAEVMQTDWDDVATLVCSCKEVDLVIHAAGMNAQECSADPVAALAFNGVATARLVSAACSAGVQRFIYLSTAHVYASPLVGPITEETFPRNLHPYATSHLAGEHVVLECNQRGLISGIVLRLSNVFGAPVCKDANCWMLLVNDLCKQAVQTNQLILHSSGLQHRDFIPVRHLCFVVEQLLIPRVSSESIGILNVGSGKSQSVLEIAHLVQQRCMYVLGYTTELKIGEPTSSDLSTQLSYDIKLLKTLGIQFKEFDYILEIDNLLRYCIASFRSNYS